MTVFIMADLEGISGVYTRDQVLPSLPRFNEGRKFLTRDINVCAEALKAAGVDKVYARDCHGGSYALLWDEVCDSVDEVIEIAIDAAILGEHNTPVIMVSGDTKACEEAKRFLPWVTTAEVKRSLHCMGASLLPPHKAKECIFAAVKEAVENFKAGKCELYKVASPIKLRVEVTERTQLPLVSRQPYVKILDGRTFEVDADSVEQALYRV